MANGDSISLKHIAGAALLMHPVSECPACGTLQVRLAEISERLTRIESMLVHITNAQFLLPTPHTYTPLSSGVSSVGPASISSGVTSAGSTSPVKRNDFDSICIPHYRKDHMLTDLTLDAIAREATRIFPNIHKRDIYSKIREWYRKRREYESQRIFTYCSRVFRQMNSEQVMDMLSGDNDFKLMELVNACRVEYDDVHKAKQYALERVNKHMMTLELYQKMGHQHPVADDFDGS